MSPPIDPVRFRETLGHYPTGVAVVTAIADDGRPVGMVVGSFTSVSLDPPLIAFFPMTASKSFAQLRTADTFCVNALASDQEDVCRRFAAGGADKFQGTSWRPGPLGSPVLDGAVSWIECAFEDIRTAGDHFVVLGRVLELDVERSTLPLLFFQGGYGRFLPRSFVAAPDPDLIRAAQSAEAIRSDVEALSDEYAANCSVLAMVGWNAVHVLAANRGPATDSLPLGHRTPLVPPLGEVFLVDAPTSEIDAWLARAPDADDDLHELYRGLVDAARARGCSLLLAEPEVLGRHEAAVAAFETSHRLARHERTVRQVTAELSELLCLDLVEGRPYDLASIVVPLGSLPGGPPMALRMAGLPGSLAAGQIESRIRSLKRVAAAAAHTAGLVAS